MELYTVAIGSFRERLVALHEDVTLLEAATAKRSRAGSGAGLQGNNPDALALSRDGGGGGGQESESARAATEMRAELDDRWHDLQSLLSETLAKLAAAINAKLGATHAKLLVRSVYGYVCTDRSLYMCEYMLSISRMNILVCALVS